MRSAADREEGAVATCVYRRVGTVLVVAALLLAFLPATTPALAAPMYGHDISWPQCSVADGGYGLPMPPASSEFVIVGLNGFDPNAAVKQGLPFFENPCLAWQLEQTSAKPRHAYAIPAFPTAAQLSTYGNAGPWSSATRAGRLSNVGYAEAGFVLATLQRVGWRPPVVWLDVEPRIPQPWPTGSPAAQRENRYVIEGMMRGLRDANMAYGLYSYANGWRAITGSWRLPGVPVWATAGKLDYPDEALDLCTRPSFSGGKVYVSQWYDDARDYDLTCDPYRFTPLPMPPSSLSNTTNEFNGDWNNDLLARETATGHLWLYPGNGRGGWLPRVRIGTGWRALDQLDTLGDFNGDGTLDVLARSPASGELWLYPGNGRGGWLPRVRVGTGWNAMNAIVGVGDWNGDQTADLLARQTATGHLWLYPGDGRGGWLPRVRVGHGWNAMNALVGPGDWNGDGTADLLARETATGHLWLYPGDGRGGWLPRVRVGHGWNAMNAIVGVGDWNGDRTADLLARETATGHLWLYPGDGRGGWLPRVRVGHGWNAMNALL
jgi:hypothetical protein